VERKNVGQIEGSRRIVPFISFFSLFLPLPPSLLNLLSLLQIVMSMKHLKKCWSSFHRLCSPQFSFCSPLLHKTCQITTILFLLFLDQVYSQMLEKMNLSFPSLVPQSRYVPFWYISHTPTTLRCFVTS
jgi:hypothetical protein